MKECKDCGSTNCMNGRRLCKDCFRIRNKKNVLKWQKTHKDKMKKIHKRYRENIFDGFYYVYCLPEKDYYVGQTSIPKRRMWQHKVKDYIELHKCKTRKEALEYEKIYHQLGFPGKRA